MTKHVTILTLAICALFSALGCVEQYDHSSQRTRARKSINLSYWVDSSISEVIQAHGPYTQVISDGAGGKVYIWVEAPSPRPPAGRPRQDEDRWVIRPHGLTGYEIERAPPRGSGILSGMRNVLEYQIEQEAAREAARPRDRVMFFARADGTIYSWWAEVRGVVYNHSVHDYGDYGRKRNASLKQKQKGGQTGNIPATKDKVVVNLATDEQRWKMRKLGIEYDDNISSEEAKKLISDGEHEKMINTLKEAQTQHGRGNRWLKDYTKD